MRTSEIIEKFKEDIFEESVQFLHEKDVEFLEKRLAYESGTLMQKIKEIILIAIELTKIRRLDVIENRLGMIGTEK